MKKLRRLAQEPADKAKATQTARDRTQLLLVEYATAYDKAFRAAHPHRKNLLLTPRDDAGVPKLVCATLRPTQFAQAALYDYATAAAFVRDFVTYEPLDLPASPPTHLPSAATVIAWQAGDAFDMANLLCSALLGVGYDAYVVSGYAPRAITLADQSEVPLPRPEKAAAALEESSEPPAYHKYFVPPSKPLLSSFLQKREAETAGGDGGAEARTVAAATTAAARDADPTAESELLDALHGKRVHAWVLLLAGKRMLESSLFIEPTSGKIYPIDDSPYYAVESVWNAANYWVNLKEATRRASGLSYDLSDDAAWEAVLPKRVTDALDDDEEDELDDAALDVGRRLSVVASATDASDAISSAAAGHRHSCHHRRHYRCCCRRRHRCRHQRLQHLRSRRRRRRRRSPRRCRGAPRRTRGHPSRQSTRNASRRAGRTTASPLSTVTAGWRSSPPTRAKTASSSARCATTRSWPPRGGTR